MKSNTTEGFVEVSKNEFFEIIRPIDTISRIIGGFPYTHEYRPRRSNTVVGKTIDSYEGNYEYPITTRYYLNSALVNDNTTINDVMEVCAKNLIRNNNK